MPKRAVSESLKRRVAAAYGWRCAQCDEMLASTYQIDHRVPLWKGGGNGFDNLQPLCADDHAKKTQLEAAERAATRAIASSAKRPVLECARCGHVVSPYFLHRCDG